MAAETQTTTDWAALIASLKDVSIEERDYTIEYDGKDACVDDHPGILLMVGNYQYNFSDAEEDDLATVEDFRALNAMALLSDEMQDAADEAVVKHDGLAPSLLDHLRSLANDVRTAAYWAVADTYAERTLLPNAPEYLIHSPRGFGNEINIYGVKAGEHEAATAWMEDRNLGANAWWKFQTADEVRQTLKSSYYHQGLSHRDNSAYQQFVICLKIDGYWNQVKAERDARDLADAQDAVEAMNERPDGE